MPRKTIYEWDVEELDGEMIAAGSDDPDIIDHHHCDTYAKARGVMDDITRDGGPAARIVLVRDVLDEDDDRVSRQWAYLQADGTLPEEFDGGARVPQRFRTEVRNAEG